MSIDLALIYPRMRYPSGDPPLGLASIAAYVRHHGYSVRIIDATWHPSVEWILDEVERLDPGAIGIYASTLMLVDAQEIGARIKLRDALRRRRRQVVMGGPHYTALPDELGLLACCDLVVRGEGEIPMLNLLSGWETTGEALDVTRAPAPALDLLDMERYIGRWHYMDSIPRHARGTNLLSARGCPFACTFCQPTLNKLFGKKVRRRTPEQVVEEMEALHERYGIHSFMFHDDTFSIQAGWLERLFAGIVKMSFFPFWGANARVDCLDEELVHRMAVHGLRAIHLGIEAASDRVRNGVLGKNTTLEQIHEAVRLCRKYRVHTGAFFMLGSPGETREEMQATVDLACALPLDEASFSLVVPLPGTYLYDQMRARGQALSDDPARYNYYASQPFEGSVPLPELKRIQRDALVRFYSQRPGYMLRHFTSLNGMRRLADKVRRFL